MRKLFVKTHNVKNFVELMNNLIDKSNEVPKMGLVYGVFGQESQCNKRYFQ